MTDYQILHSHKAGLPSPESYVVVRSKTSFLRLLGQQPYWELMTATASEDTGGVQVCSSHRRLIDAALRTSLELGGTQPKVEADWLGREYVKLCVLRQDAGESDALVKSQLDEVIERFFGFYDSYESPDLKDQDELRSLYSALAIDEGEDVYLSDGLWLRSDGSVEDRRR